MRSACLLCGELAALRQSHILPAFVFRWLKETSGTGYLRFGTAPNKRVQDGATRPWLCAACEALLNSWETPFASRVFHPINAEPRTRIRYEPWLLKFATSLSWRTLTLYKLEHDLNHLAAEQCTIADAALARWREFLRGEVPHPDIHEQHVIVLDAIDRYTGGQLPANINRYFLRTVDIDVVAGRQTAFVMSKVGRFVFLGFIGSPPKGQWAGTKIRVNHGFIGATSASVPTAFGRYLIGKAERYGNLLRGLSPAQRRKIDEAAKAQIDRVAHSESVEAMAHDVRLFGAQAFEIHQSPDEDSGADDKK